MTKYYVVERRSIYRTYEVEAGTADEAFQTYEDWEDWEDDEATIDTEVIAVEDENHEPVGEWVTYDRYGNQSNGHRDYEGALRTPSWIAPDEWDQEDLTA